jgi:hypothetical protein
MQVENQATGGKGGLTTCDSEGTKCKYESSSESESKDHDVTSDGDITEHESRCRELKKSIWNSYWESAERAEERFTIEGTSSRLPGAAATCGSYEATICEEGAASLQRGWQH